MTATATKPEVHPTIDFRKNLNDMPESIWAPYIDQFVAYSLDGKQILAGAPTMEEVEEKLIAMGIDPSHVVGGHVDDPSLVYLSAFK